MQRIILMVIKCLYIAPFWFYRICQFAKDTECAKYSMEERYAYIAALVRKVNKKGRVEVITSGLENLPEKDGYIMYPNHQGMFDMLAVTNAFPRPYGIVLKHEVKDIILLKQIIAALKYLPMDRSDLKQSARVILEVTKRVKAGENFLIFPEGTRSRNGNELLEFKAGAFKAATKAKAPIVPVALLDSFLPFDQNTIKPAVVRVHYLPPMYYEEYADMNTTQIASEVEDRIKSVLKKI